MHHTLRPLSTERYIAVVPGVEKDWYGDMIVRDGGLGSDHVVVPLGGRWKFERMGYLLPL